jgi:hypothetical protein
LKGRQRLLIIVALIIAATGLSVLMLDWQDGWQEGTPIHIFFTEREASGVTHQWGLYTRYGIAGRPLGIIVPLILLGAAAFIAVDRKTSN